MRRSWIAITLFVATACGSSPPPAPSPGPGSGNAQSITGRERIGWDQPADSSLELATFHYAIYVDGVRNLVADSSCSTASSSSSFACSGKLPAMSNGSHTLELATFLDGEDGDIVEGGRSVPLQVSVSALTAPAAAGWTSGQIETTRDGVKLRIDKVVEGLDRPIDAAVVPDGRLFIAERGGRIRLVTDGQLQDRDALAPITNQDDGVEVLSLAVDPDFERTHFIFLAHTATSYQGPVFRLSRYRELRGQLAERAVLFETDAPSARASAVARFGPDGKLYLAVSGNPQGRLFRLAADGMLPRDQAGTTPAIAAGIGDARGLGWDPQSGLLWIADESDGTAHVSGIALSPPPIRAIVRGRATLHGGFGQLAFYTNDAIPGIRNEALLASTDGYILRLGFAEDDPTRIRRSGRLLENLVGPIQVVIVAPDGAIYFCTDDALGRITAPR